MQVWFLGQEDHLEEGIATHSSLLVWRVPKDRGAWQATVHRSQRVRHNWSILACTQANKNIKLKCYYKTDIVILTYVMCCRRLLRVPWTARRSNQSILKEISPGLFIGRTDAEPDSPVMVGYRASRRGKEGLSRSFSECSRKPWVHSTCASDRRELLRVPLRIRDTVEF